MLSLGVSLAATLALTLSFYNAVNQLTIDRRQVDSSRQVVSELLALQASVTREFKETVEWVVLGSEEEGEILLARVQANGSFDRLKKLNAAETLAAVGRSVHEKEEEEERKLFSARRQYTRI